MYGSIYILIRISHGHMYVCAYISAGILICTHMCMHVCMHACDYMCLYTHICAWCPGSRPIFGSILVGVEDGAALGLLQDQLEPESPGGSRDSKEEWAWS